MASSRIIACVVLLAALVCGATGDAQQPVPSEQQDRHERDQQVPPADRPPPPPVFRAGINFVRVDVIVTDRTGRAVADLQPGDFEIIEEGKPQKIETFRYIELNGGLTQDAPSRAIRTDADEEAEAARDDVRLFAMFLDDYHVRRESSLASRQELARFVETQLGPSDMVALMYPLDPVAAVRFTRNHGAVQRGLLQFVGRKFEYEAQNAFELKYHYYPAETVERIRNQVSLSALKSLIVHMGGLKEGRKALVLVSEGYSNMLPPQLRNPIATFPGFGNPNRSEANAGVGDLNEFRAQALSSFDMQQELRQIYTTANRYNVAIYAVDPRGLASSDFNIADNIGAATGRDYLNSTMNTLRVLSAETDGRAIVSRNDLTLAMKQIVGDSSAYYLIGYNSTEAPTDGKFHEIKVRVKRSATQVRARRGYWAFTTADVVRAVTPPKPGPPKPLEAALAAIGYPSRARLIRTWIGTERGENGKTRVTFVWEPVPRPPGSPSRSSDQPVRVLLTAAGPDGAPYFRGRVPATVAGATASTPRVTFDAPPGALQLRLSIEGPDSDVLDSETRDLTIPDMMSSDALFGTPQIFRARTARDVQQLKTNPGALPTAAREFLRSERLLVRVPVYGPGNTPPPASARLLNRDGRAMSQVPVTMTSEESGATIELGLASLALGEYVIEITIASGSGDVEELIGFRVIG